MRENEMSPTTTVDIPGQAGKQWTVETAMSHCLSVITATQAHLSALIELNDRRYAERLSAAQKELDVAVVNRTTTVNMAFESADLRYQQRFDAQQKALELGFAGQKSAVEAAFAAQEKAITAALASADRAVTKAELASDKRFEGVNEFRAALDNQQRTLIPRSEVDVMFRGLERSIADIVKQQDAQTAERIGVRGGWGYAVGLIGFVIAILTIASLVFRAQPQNIVVPAATVAPSSQLPSVVVPQVPRP